VHAVEVLGLPRVDLDDHLVGVLEVGAVHADRRRGDDVAVLGDRARLDDGEVELAEEALGDLRAHVGQMDVLVVRRAVVDGRAHLGVRLVRGAVRDAAGAREGAVEFRGRRGSGPHADAELLAAVVRGVDHSGERLRERLRVAGAGEAREADVPAVLDQLCGVVSRHDLVPERLATDAT